MKYALTQKQVARTEKINTSIYIDQRETIPEKKKEGKTKMIIKKRGRKYAMLFHKEKCQWVYIPEKRFLKMSTKELYNYEW